MANYTQDLIIEKFNHMLERMPFDKITVTALIKECNIGRNTFYYHYDDIYALLDDALQQWLGPYLEASQEENWQDVLKTILHFCQDHKKKIYHIFNSLSRDQLAHYIFDRIDASISLSVENFAKKQAGDMDRAKVIGDVICYSVYGYFMRFLWNGMEDDIDESIDELKVIFDDLLESLVQK